MIPWSAFYKFAFVDWVVLEDVALVLLVILVWKLYRSMRRIEDRLKEMDDPDSLDDLRNGRYKDYDDVEKLIEDLHSDYVVSASASLIPLTRRRPWMKRLSPLWRR